MEPLDRHPLGVHMETRKDRTTLVGVVAGAITGAIAVALFTTAVVIFQ